MNSALLDELSYLFSLESDAIRDPYANPPKRHAEGELDESHRLLVTAARIRYRADLAAQAMPEGG